MGIHRKLILVVSVLGLLLPAAALAASAPAGTGGRGIVIGEVGLDAQGMFGASVRWDRKELKGGKVNSLNLSLVASDGGAGVPVFMREVPATAKRPTRDYVLSLNPVEQALVQQAAGLGMVAVQKVDLDGGLFDRAWVAGVGDLPVGPSVRASCSPIQPGGSYTRCNYSFSNLSNMDLHGADFTDAQFAYSTLVGANFSTATLSYAVMGYANLSNANLSGATLPYAVMGYANLSNANLSGATLSNAQMGRANLSNANLSGATMTGVYLFGANMKDANVTGATFRYAEYCNTVMPDGTVNNADC